MQTLLIEISLLLPFLSGSAMMHIIADRRKWDLTMCEKIFSGALLGNFLLVAPSVLIGFFTNYLNGLFGLYTLFSLATIVLSCFYIVSDRTRGKKGWYLFLKTKLASFGFKVYILPILLFALLILFLHTIYFEYDAIYVYFPYAKSIALTGSMKYNVYDQSALSTGMPPILPIIYAWGFTAINDLNAIGIHNDIQMNDLLRPIPAAYFLLTALAIYLITSEALQKKHAFLSVIIFMSLPNTIFTLSAFSYYLDLGFVFYIVSSLLSLIKALKTRKPIWFFFTGVASSLVLLTKELSLFIVPLFLSIFLLSSSTRLRRLFFVMLSTLPFYLVFIWDTYNSPISEIGWVLMRQLPVFALSFILYYLSNTIRRSDGHIAWKNFVISLIPLIPSVVFFLRNIAFLGSVYAIWGPAFNHPNYLFYAASGTRRAIGIADFFRWDIPFLSLGLGASYLIPILFSIAYFLKRRRLGDRPSTLIVLMTLLTLLETVSFTLVGSQPESRRMYYFAPILAIFASSGLMFFDDFLRRKYFIYLCLIFNSFVISYIWLYKFPFRTLFGLSHHKMSFGSASALDFVFFAIVFVDVFLLIRFAQGKLLIENPGISIFGIRMRKKVAALPLRIKSSPTKNPVNSEERMHGGKVPAYPVKQRKLRLQNLWKLRVGSQGGITVVKLFLLTLSFLLVIYPTIPIWLEAVNRDSDFFCFQHDVFEQIWENGIMRVSDYYIDQIEDHYVTVSFGGRALRYFANRSVIDLTGIIGVQSIQEILTKNASAELWQALCDSEIRYFLIPLGNNSFSDLYQSFRDRFYLFRFMEEDARFKVIKEFDYFKLVAFEY